MKINIKELLSILLVKKKRLFLFNIMRKFDFAINN